MSFACPVCNGLRAVSRSCPQCGRPLSDGGRVDEYIGPYAPYRPIDDMKLTNGYPDLAEHACYHQLFCAECGYRSTVEIKEWPT